MISISACIDNSHEEEGTMTIAYNKLIESIVNLKKLRATLRPVTADTDDVIKRALHVNL